MKRILLSLLFVNLMIVVITAQQDTIIGWVFPSDTVTNTDAEFGLPGNLGYDLRAEDTSYTQRTIQFKNGSEGTGDYAAQATGWDNGAHSKNWSIKFKADGYSDFKVSAKLSSGGNDPGPKYWFVEARFSGGSWQTISDTIEIANDWTTGVINELSMPASFDDPGTTSIYVRFISITDEDISGGTVASGGKVKIDNIIVTATATSGKEEIVYDSNLCVYPNPANDQIFVKSDRTIENITILNVAGQVVIDYNPVNQTSDLDISHLDQGVYFVRIIYDVDNHYHVEKVIVQ